MNNDSILRQTLAELKLTGRYAGYAPSFRAEEFSPANWWVLDGETRVGAVLGESPALELVNFDPSAPRAVEFPEVYHAPTAPGDRITLAHWVEWAQSTGSERNELRFSAGGERLTVTFEEWFADGMHAVKRCTFAVDPDLGYVVEVEGHVQSPVEHQVEFANFLPQNVVDDRQGRWPFILWQHPDGRILRWNQNNAGADAYGNRDHHGRRQIDPEGFLGYFGEPDRCPVAEFHGSNQPIAATTCHNMLDEHLHWVVGRDFSPPRNEAGQYVYDVAFTLGALPGAAGAKLAERAEFNDLMLERYPSELAGRYPWTPGETGPLRPMDMVVFRQGSLCDFTERLDARASDRSMIFTCPENDENAPATIVPEGGRRTGPCLRLQPGGGRVGCGPTYGCSPHVTAGAAYQVTAWLKTDLHPGSARLRVWEWLYTAGNLTREYLSLPVEGKSEWTKVSVEFTPEGTMTHCMSLEIVAEGEGTVWADELMVEAL
jgi:hypothetical protein